MMREKGLWKRALAFLLSLVLVLGLAPANSLKTEASGGEVVLRFLVASDIHLDAKTEDKKAKQLKGMFASAYAYAATQSYKKVDAAVLVGDIVNYGYVEEYEALKSVLASSGIKEETEVLTLMGNHEWWRYINNGETNLGSTSYLNGIANIPQITEKGLNWSKTISGYQFIGMSPLCNDTYGADNYNWMSGEVEKAVAAEAAKPVFTFQHHAIAGTVYGSNGSGPMQGENSTLNSVYEGHHQVINFSGHSHAPINTPTAINQTTYTQYTTGTMYAICADSSATYGGDPPNRDNVGQYTIVEVYKDNTVKLIPYDQFTDSRFRNLNGDGTYLEYSIDVNAPENWQYRKETRTDRVEAPYFSTSASVKTSDLTYKSVKVTFNQAKDNSGVYAYDIVCTPASGTEVTHRIFSEWYFQPMPSSLSYNVTGLQENMEYSIAVYPVDFFDNKGTAITTSVKTPGKQDADNLTLTFKEVNSDGAWLFDTSNPTAVAGQYYKVPVTIDGKDGHVIISKQGEGEQFCIWANFFGLCGDAETPVRNFKIEKGAVMKEVSSSSWNKEIQGGDSITIGETVYVKKTAGIWITGTESADDNIVYEPEAFTTNLIPYGDCETGSASDWAIFSNAQYVTDRAHGGARSLKLSNNGSPAQVRLNLRGIVPQSYYRVSAWVYVDTDVPSINVQRELFVAIESPWSMLDSSYGVVSERKGEWVKYEFSFQAKENANLVQIGFYTSDVGTSFYLDDLEVYRVCTHEHLKHVEARPACVSNGNIEYWECRTCGTYFADAEATKEITDKASVTLPAIGKHIYKKQIKKATTKYWGSIVEVCACGDRRETKIAPATNIKLSKTSLVYNKKKQKVTLTVKDSKGKVIPSSEYTVSGATSGTKVGSYTLKVTFKSSSSKYTGSKTLTWKIYPKGTKTTSVRGGWKSVTVKWAKQTSETTGYTLQISTDKKFKKSVKTIKVTKNKTTSKVIKGLKAKKKYYVRIRTYKGSYTSTWSTVKSVKTK